MYAKYIWLFCCHVKIFYSFFVGVLFSSLIHLSSNQLSLRKAQPTKLWANSSHYYFTCDLSVGSRLVGLPSLLFINLIHNVHHVACSATLAKIISVTAIGIGYSLIRITVRCYGDSAIFFLCISFSFSFTLAFGPRLFIFIFIFIFMDKPLRYVWYICLKLKIVIWKYL